MPGTRMSGADLKTSREYLGLPQDALGAILGVEKNTVARWEQGLSPVSYRIPAEIDRIKQHTSSAVAALSAEIKQTGGPAIVFYSDAEFQDAMPAHASYTARWWRHVVARACDTLPDTKIIYPQDA